jgi:hypothetical protein
VPSESARRLPDGLWPGSLDGLPVGLGAAAAVGVCGGGTSNSRFRAEPARAPPCFAAATLLILAVRALSMEPNPTRI